MATPRAPVLASEFSDETIVAKPAATCGPDAESLATFMRGWISRRGPMGLFVDPKGVLVGKKKVRGDEAAWLLSYVRDELQMSEPITCCDHRCTYDGGALTLIPSDDAWMLTAWSVTARHE